VLKAPLISVNKSAMCPDVKAHSLEVHDPEIFSAL